METHQLRWLSPIGLLSIEATEQHLVSVAFLDDFAPQLPPNPSPPTFLEEVLTQLKSYFKGGKSQFSLPIAFEGTPFQQRVWRAIASIPLGETRTYQSLASELGDTKAVRAIGSASALNKLLIVIPCHRIVGSDGSLTGYAGGLWRKKWLLEHEQRIAGKPQQLSIF